MKDLHSIFVPLVIGTISLIAWLSVRNESVSSRIRKTIDDLLDSQKCIVGIHASYLQTQLLNFIPRYRQNTIALRSVIVSSLALGPIFGVWLHYIFSPDGFDFSEWIVLVCFSLGALLIAYGIFRSIQEIERGQLTLYTHVACCLQLRPIDPKDNETRRRLDEVISIIGEAGIGPLEIDEIKKPAPSTKDSNNSEQAGTGQPATRPEPESEGGDKPQPEAEGRSQ